MQKHITTYESSSTWTNITRQQRTEAAYLEKNFSFSPRDVTEILPPLQRTKVKERPGYLFLVLVFPVYDRKNGTIVPTELDVFLTRDKIVTAHDNSLPPLREMEKAFRDDPIMAEKFLSTSPLVLLVEILESLYRSIFPMLNHMSNDINEMEISLFSSKRKDLTAHLLKTKQNIIAARKFLSTHKRTMQRLRELVVNLDEDNAPIQSRLDEIAEHTREIWDELENYAYTITAIHESHESFKSHRLNTIMKTLTIFSVIVFPLTLFAALFGMNTPHMPLVDHPYGFWIIMGLMTVAMLVMLIVFKVKKWI